MVDAAEWIRVRSVERLASLLNAFGIYSGKPQPGPNELSQADPNGFLLTRVAELQAQVEYLEARIESIQGTKH